MAMNISLTPEIEQIVSERVASGRYRSAVDVIREALELLIVRDASEEQHLDQLRAEIAVGLDQLRRGEGVSGDHVFDELRRRSEERRREPA